MSDEVPHVELRMRLVGAGGMPIGPGKIALLEAIARTGSISAAAREHGMSYSRAWKLVSEVNAAFDEPLVAKATGGAAGGGALVSERALELVSRYRKVEAEARRLAEAELAGLLRGMASGD